MHENECKFVSKMIIPCHDKKKKMNCLPIKQNIISNVFYKVSLRQKVFRVKEIIERSDKCYEAVNFLCTSTAII